MEAEFKPCSKIWDVMSVFQSNLILRGNRILVPQSLRKRVVSLAHEGHQGMEKTKRLIRERVWFPGIDAEVEEAVKQCKPCQLTSSQSSPAPIMSSEFPENPWENVAIDFHGPLNNGSYLMVLIDEHSKFPIVEEVKSTASQHVLPRLDETFSLMGIPKV